MNKKIFTLFLVVALSAVLAVSCNNKTTNPVKNPNTGGTTETTPGTGGTTETTPTTPTKPSNPSGGEEAKKTEIKTDDIQKALINLAAKKDNEGAATAIVKFDKSQLTIAEAKVSGVVATGKADAAKGPSLNGTKKVIATLKDALKISGVKTVEVNDDKISGKDNSAKTFTITLTADDKYEFSKDAKLDNGKLVLTVSVEPKKGNADETTAWED